jgi:hypothetical protein
MNLRDVRTAGKLRNSKETISAAQQAGGNRALAAVCNYRESVNSPLLCAIFRR